MEKLENLFITKNKLHRGKIRGAMLKFMKEVGKVEGREDRKMCRVLFDSFDEYMQEKFGTKKWHNFLRKYRISWTKMEMEMKYMIHNHESFVKNMKKTYIPYDKQDD